MMGFGISNIESLDCATEQLIILGAVSQIYSS
jgi:hypothetical protein